MDGVAPPRPSVGTLERPVTGLDWLILGVVLLLALYGWAQGFVTGALALAGFALGAFAGTRLGPAVLGEGRASPWAPAFGLIGALLAGAVLALGFEGIGARVRARLRSPVVATVDGALGAALTACIGLGICWVLGAMALGAGGELRRGVQRSVILQRLNTALPPSGGLVGALARLDPFPRLDGPEARVAPPRGTATRGNRVASAAGSVAKILGTACGLGVEGSGWVAGPGLVVTNAHVVAGQRDTRVLLRGQGDGLRAFAVAFDPRNDIAVLRVPGLSAPALRLAPDPKPGVGGAILGFPQNGPYSVRAGRLGQTRAVITQDAYGRGPVRRTITALRGRVRPGNSGGPMVDRRGRVLTTVFAATTRGPRGGYGVPDGIIRSTLRGAGGKVSTGPCAR